MGGFHFCLYFTASLFLFLSPVLAEIDVDVASESIVRVRAYKNDKVIAEGSGFVVNEEGHVLTNAHVLEDARRLTVLSLKTGAEMLSQKVFARRDMNLALLRAQGLNLPPLSLSEQGADVGRAVQTLRFGTAGDLRPSHGTIDTYQDIRGKKASRPVAHLLQYNALITAKSFGMPLFNECGDVVAINLPDPSGRWPFRKAKPRGAIFALRSGDIIAALEEREIAHTVVEAECLSVVERIERDREAVADSLKVAKAMVDSLEVVKAWADSVVADSLKAATEKADSLEVVADSLKAATEKAGEKVDSLEVVKARADSVSEAKADSLKAATEKADSLKMVQARADSVSEAKADSLKAATEKAAQRLQWGLAAGAGLVLLALFGWWLSARHAPKPAPFKCLLRGQDNTGREFALNIPALALGAPAGVILGRSPANAEFVIDHKAISRAHLRLTYTEGTLHAEDLNSTNGTRVNRQSLNPGEQVVLQDNDQLEMGLVVFQVRLIQE